MLLLFFFLHSCLRSWAVSTFSPLFYILNWLFCWSALKVCIYPPRPCADLNRRKMYVLFITLRLLFSDSVISAWRGGWQLHADGHWKIAYLKIPTQIWFANDKWVSFVAKSRRKCEYRRGRQASWVWRVIFLYFLYFFFFQVFVFYLDIGINARQLTWTCWN